jgi:curli biogenesis system outer membrane secretion channel CsgG
MLQLDGADTLFEAKLSNSGCFNLVERKQLDALLAEHKLCDEANPDKKYLDCKNAWAEPGKILGLSRRILGEITFYEKDVEGAELNLKIPGLGGIKAGTRYTALSLVAKIVDVETGLTLSTATVHASVPTDEAGIDLELDGFDLKAGAWKNTPFGESIDKMLADATSLLVAGLGDGATPVPAKASGASDSPEAPTATSGTPAGVAPRVQ